MIATYPPRHCGIATFTADLRAALVGGSDRWPVGSPLVVALDHGRGDPPSYPPEVAHRLRRGDHRAYRGLGRELRGAGVEVVSLQHEYGIFGGHSGRDVLELLDGISVPLVTTLHTVIRRPQPLQRSVMAELIERSWRVVVMSDLARRRVQEAYGVDDGTLAVIPHGVPEIPPVDPRVARRRLGLSDEPLLLAFGLLGPAKRLELVIDALGQIKGRVALPRFVILGATHPEVRRRHGERYRASLIEQVGNLGLDDHVTFVDRYVEDHELIAWLQACDMFVTPYGNEEQVSSGTLSLAAAAGSACISTPYEHARALLADGRGVLVPFNDADAIADSLAALLADPDHRRRLGEQARAHAASMAWPVVAGQYREIFEAAAARAEARAASLSGRAPSPAALRVRHRRPALPMRAPLPGVARRHLDRMSDGIGLMQHAVGLRPDPRHGSCTDDVARSILVHLLHARVAPSAGIALALRRSLAFLESAFDPGTGRFRNFRSADGRWLESIGSEDSHGRALQGLGEILGGSTDVALVTSAAPLFEAALPAALGFSNLRPRCYAAVGCAAALRRREFPAAASALNTLASDLAGLTAATPADWPWPEPVATYDNGVLPQALIVAGEALHRPDWISLGIDRLEWLLAAQVSASGELAPIGNDGWWPRWARPARFEQQPIEATSLLEAARAALLATGERRFADEMERCYAWFLGANDLGLSLADPATGACHDGLGSHESNANCGAESMLAWLVAVERIRELRGASLEIPAQTAEAGAVAGGIRGRAR
jgi:glycosyltransferase involved in cell wall biosynthesis